MVKYHAAPKGVWEYAGRGEVFEGLSIWQKEKYRHFDFLLEGNTLNESENGKEITRWLSKQIIIYIRTTPETATRRWRRW